MIQKGDDLINGVNNNYHYYHANNNSEMTNGVEFEGNNDNLTMSFEDYVPLESTLPSVETVLPQYIPTPPPSLPSPSVNISTVNTTVPPFQFQLQRQTSTPPSLQLQHNQNINNCHHYYYEQQHQQVGFHSSSPFQMNRAHNNKNIESTINSQLLVDHIFANQSLVEADNSTIDTSPNTSNNHSIQSQETVLHASDSSTVDANESDHINDDQFTYLQNLNSDNLMKFSQIKKNDTITLTRSASGQSEKTGSQMSLSSDCSSSVVGNLATVEYTVTGSKLSDKTAKTDKEVEKKKKRSLYMKIYKAKQSEKAREARLQQQRQHAAEMRSLETEQARKVRLEQVRKYKIKTRISESEQARKARLEQVRKHMTDVRASESEQAREARLQQARQYKTDVRASESEQAREARLQQARQYMTHVRASESEQAREARLQQARQYMADARALESEQAREARLQQVRQYMTDVRASESEQAREARLQQARKHMTHVRASESEQAREARLQQARQYMTDVRASESEQAREARLQQARRYMADARALESEQAREARLQQARQYMTDVRASESEQAREARLQQARQYMADARASESEQAREARLQQVRQYMADARALESEQAREARLQQTRQRNAESRRLSRSSTIVSKQTINTVCDKQSVLQQLIQEQIDVKPNLDLIPTSEEHDHGGYNFQIKVNCIDEHAQRPGVVYSKETERLYLKTNENVYIDCSYTQKMPIQPLKIRIFLIFEKDASSPVLRCQNHISTDSDPNEIIRKSLVRCKNRDVVYHGSDTGKAINDRYSVVVPLNSTVKGTETNQLKQQLIVSFTCYNSCMNRKQTAVIFLLEGMNGEVLAQRMLSVKISTCPKRDRRLYESADVNVNKRKHSEDTNCASTEAKMSKYDNTLVKDEYSRSSFDDGSDDGGTPGSFSGTVHHETETGDFVLTLKCKSRQHILQAISAIYGDTVKNEELRRSCVNGKRNRDSDWLKKLYYSACNIKTRNCPSVSTE